MRRPEAESRDDVGRPLPLVARRVIEDLLLVSDVLEGMARRRLERARRRRRRRRQRRLRHRRGARGEKKNDCESAAHRSSWARASSARQSARVATSTAARPAVVAPPMSSTASLADGERLSRPTARRASARSGRFPAAASPLPRRTAAPRRRGAVRSRGRPECAASGGRSSTRLRCGALRRRSSAITLDGTRARRQAGDGRSAGRSSKHCSRRASSIRRRPPRRSRRRRAATTRTLELHRPLGALIGKKSIAGMPRRTSRKSRIDARRVAASPRRARADRRYVSADRLRGLDQVPAASKRTDRHGNRVSRFQVRALFLDLGT